MNRSIKAGREYLKPIVPRDYIFSLSGLPGIRSAPVDVRSSLMCTVRWAKDEEGGKKKEEGKWGAPRWNFFSQLCETVSQVAR